MKNNEHEHNCATCKHLQTRFDTVGKSYECTMSDEIYTPIETICWCASYEPKEVKM